MKKRWKIFWAVCAVTAGLGLVCCVTALALGVSVEMLQNRLPNGIGLVVKATTWRAPQRLMQAFKRLTWNCLPEM